MERGHELEEAAKKGLRAENRRKLGGKPTGLESGRTIKWESHKLEVAMESGERPSWESCKPEKVANWESRKLGRSQSGRTRSWQGEKDHAWKNPRHTWQDLQHACFNMHGKLLNTHGKTFNRRGLAPQRSRSAAIAMKFLGNESRTSSQTTWCSSRNVISRFGTPPWQRASCKTATQVPHRVRTVSTPSRQPPVRLTMKRLLMTTDDS